MSPRVLSCKICGRIFQSMGASYCPVCAEEMDKAFTLVKEYLYSHENATVLDIVEATGVTEKFVLYFLKEGRLNVEETDASLRCEDCGRPIPSGRYCSTCREKLANALSSVVSKEKDSPVLSAQAKMHAKYGRD